MRSVESRLVGRAARGLVQGEGIGSQPRARGVFCMCRGLYRSVLLARWLVRILLHLLTPAGAAPALQRRRANLSLQADLVDVVWIVLDEFRLKLFV